MISPTVRSTKVFYPPNNSMSNFKISSPKVFIAVFETVPKPGTRPRLSRPQTYGKKKNQLYHKPTKLNITNIKRYYDQQAMKIYLCNCITV